MIRKGYKPSTASIDQTSFEVEYLIKLRNQFIIPLEMHQINWSSKSVSILEHLEEFQFTQLLKISFSNQLNHNKDVSGNN